VPERGIGLMAWVCVGCIDVGDQFSAQVADVTRGSIPAEQSPVCGGGDLHGHTSQLTPQQLGDLVAYLKTL
jgi:hypothetical protein